MQIDVCSLLINVQTFNMEIIKAACANRIIKQASISMLHGFAL